MKWNRAGLNNPPIFHLEFLVHVSLKWHLPSSSWDQWIAALHHQAAGAGKEHVLPLGRSLHQALPRRASGASQMKSHLSSTGWYFWYLKTYFICFASCVIQNKPFKGSQLFFKLRGCLSSHPPPGLSSRSKCWVHTLFWWVLRRELKNYNLP